MGTKPDLGRSSPCVVEGCAKLTRLVSHQAMLLVSAVFETINTTAYGLGEHADNVPLENIENLVILGQCAGTFGILSSVASKTSFALTLVRLADGWLRALLWIAIVSMNILMPLSALFLWIDCNPLAKKWNPYLPGKCWDPQISVVYGIVVGSMFSLP